MNADASPILSATDLTKVFCSSRTRGVSAVESVELAIPEGSYALFRGPSGSGKTTLFALLAGIASPTRGAVYFGEENLNDLSDVALCRLRRNRIGFIFQDFHLFPRLNVLENASLPLVPLGLTRKERHRKAALLLERLGLEDRLHHYPEEMSGGERQRLSIARGLANDPTLVFADEPVSNIDRDSADTVARLFRELKARGKTLLVTSHHDAVFRDADLFFGMDHGRLSKQTGRNAP